MISYGEGSTSVLLWSQMHGNEPTATMALMDMFHLLKAKDDKYDEFRELIHSSLTLHFIPMLNPDGAQRYERRNVSGIDINRDALRQQTAEGRILKRVRDSLDADWGFNLHDQGRATQVDRKPASISFLAPAFNFAVDTDEKRENAMQLIVVMNNEVQKYFPDQVGRYWDSFEPRAFGDNLQKWGTRTILIESGGLHHDREKQLLRKINYHMMLTAFHSIATSEYENYSQEDYNAIPNNSGRNLQELILRNVEYDGIKRDIAFQSREVQNEDATQFYIDSYISDIGDLSRTYAYEEFDAAGYKVEIGQVVPKAIISYQVLTDLDLNDFREKGFTDFVVSKGLDRYSSNLPVGVHSQIPTEFKIDVRENPSLLFRKDGKVKYGVINGTLYDFSERKSTSLTSMDQWDQIGEVEWKLEQETFTGKGGNGPGYLVSKGTYEDFELELEFKPAEDINSGIFIRTVNTSEINADDAYEFNIWDDNPNQDFRTGGVVGFAKPLQKVETTGKWNTYRIRVEGPMMEAWVNGIKTVELTDDRNSSGKIMMQLFKGSSISFRNIKLTEL